MSAPDLFARFVDQLADTLDDHATGAEERAGRLHFSRFHMDRLVAAVGGEPPETLRRRVLLERAAYRMLTTRAPLIDIAVEAGYSSHAAFTRAFARAYGRAPSAWRRLPGQIRLDTPNGVHFHPPSSLRLPARRTVTSMELSTRMVEHHIWLTGELVSHAGRLTDKRLDQAIVIDVDDDGQTVRSLLSRLVGQMGMWNAALADRAYDWSVEDHEPLDAMRERLAEEGPRFLVHVRGVVARDQLDETCAEGPQQTACCFRCVLAWCTIAGEGAWPSGEPVLGRRLVEEVTRAWSRTGSDGLRRRGADRCADGLGRGRLHGRGVGLVAVA